jgi:cell division GTPase FtsZ
MSNLLFISDVLEELLKQSLIVLILVAGMVIMWKHFKAEVCELKDALKEKDKLIERKDTLLTDQYNQLSELLKKDAEANKEISVALTTLTKVVETWIKK